jgi:hypothetical protein
MIELFFVSYLQLFIGVKIRIHVLITSKSYTQYAILYVLHNFAF